MKGRPSVHFQFILALIVITLSSNPSSEALSDDLTITIGRQVHSEVEVNLEILNSLPASNFSPSYIGRSKQKKEFIDWDINQDLESYSNLNKGDRVFHQKFGYGKILYIEGDKAEVGFEKGSRKKVFLKFLQINF